MNNKQKIYEAYLNHILNVMDIFRKELNGEKVSEKEMEEMRARFEVLANSKSNK